MWEQKECDFVTFLMMEGCESKSSRPIAFKFGMQLATDLSNSPAKNCLQKFEIKRFYSWRKVEFCSNYAQIEAL
jgi:hypothetical protein